MLKIKLMMSLNITTGKEIFATSMLTVTLVSHLIFCLIILEALILQNSNHFNKIEQIKTMKLYCGIEYFVYDIPKCLYRHICLRISHILYVTYNCSKTQKTINNRLRLSYYYYSDVKTKVPNKDSLSIVLVSIHLKSTLKLIFWAYLT